MQQNIQNYNQQKAYRFMFKPKNQRPTCTRHHFSLKPRNDYVVRPQNLSISFCKEQCGQFHKSKHVKRANSCLNCPTFNKDSNHISPAFILRSEKKQYQEKKSQIQTDQQEQYLEQTDSKSSIKIPKPNSKNRYCSVCHVNYDDYLQHIQNPFHLGKIKKSSYNHHIQQLASTFRQKINKEKALNLETKETLIDKNDSQDVHIIQHPQKKNKTDSSITRQTTQPAQCVQTAQNIDINSFVYPQDLLDFARKSAQFYQHQLTLSSYWNFFPVYPQNITNIHPFLTIQTIPYPLFTINNQSQAKEMNSTSNPIPCIVIDD